MDMNAHITRPIHAHKAIPLQRWSLNDVTSALHTLAISPDEDIPSGRVLGEGESVRLSFAGSLVAMNTKTNCL
jgi:hypothetical protein